MMNMRLVLFTLVSMTVMSGSVWAEDRRSVEALLPGCRFQASSPAPVQDSEWTQALMCRDAIDAVVKSGPMQPSFLSSCVPENTPPQLVARTIVAFLEQDLQRIRERFDIRAAAALHASWPCH